MHHQNLWAPWRIGYIKGVVDAEAAGRANECFLCEATGRDHDAAALRERLVLVRDERGLLLLNRYPYTNGHLLAAPADHVPELTDMTPAARAGLMELCELGTRLLQAAMNPQGINVGMNIGRCAGAGLPGHAHMHVVPRWNGDVNFMQVVGQVRVIPEALESSYDALLQALADES